MNESASTFDIEQLSVLTGTSRRTIRFYVQEGVLPRPDGSGRGSRYTREHLERLLSIRRWQDEGLTLDGIRQRIEAAGGAAQIVRPRRPGDIEVWSRLVVADGVELQVEPGTAGLSPEGLCELFRVVAEAYRRIAGQEEEGQ